MRPPPALPRLRPASVVLCVLVLLAASCRSADSWVRRGTHARKPALKVRYFGEALALEPDRVDARRGRGLARILAGDHAGALEDLDQVLTTAPDDAEALNGRGVAQLQLGRLDEAGRDLQRAVQVRPTLAVAHLNLGTLAEARKQLDPAREHYDRAIRLDTRLEQAYFRRARLHFVSGRLAEARRDYRWIQDEGEQLPTRLLAGRDLVLTWLAEGALDPAMSELEHQLSVLPTPQLRFLLGALSFVRGQLRPAAMALIQAQAEGYQRGFVFLLLVLVAERVYGAEGPTGQPHQQKMQQILRGEKIAGWPRPVMEVFAGQRAPKDALAAADGVLERSEAAYYLGELALHRGDVASARTLLRQAAEMEGSLSPERFLAQLRLAALARPR